MTDGEGSGQRPEEECRLGEGYLTQGEEGRGGRGWGERQPEGQVGLPGARVLRWEGCAGPV